MVAPTNGKGFHMNEDLRKNLSREERLAAKLRENLRRRKAQGKTQARTALGDLGAAPDESSTETLPNRADES